MQIIQLGLRGLQLIFCAVVLALSVVLVKQAAPDYPSSGQSLLSFSAFCGAFGLIIAALGIVAAFVDKLPGFIIGGIDALQFLFLLAAGCAFAAKIGVGSCNADAKSIEDFTHGVKNAPKPGKYASLYTTFNLILSGGYGYDDNFNFVARCQECQADVAFLFFAMAVFLASVIMDFCASRSSSTTTSSSGGGFKFPKFGRKGPGYV